MLNSVYKVIGVMSGTSLDGIDLAYIIFTKTEQNWFFDIQKSETISYDSQWKEDLEKLIFLSKDELEVLDNNYTLLLANTINAFINKHDLTNIDAICSHGHTALHTPEQGFTYQIGNLSNLADQLKQTVVCDFRVQDVKLGGQGAPLVPIGDELLFSDHDYCLNLGGFANISTKRGRDRIAYDICPVNIVMNHYTKQIGLEYDDKGSLASSGEINEQLLNQLNALEFYKESFPKSLGLEWVTDYIFPITNSYELSVKDILRTFVEHIAYQISNVIEDNKKVLITGGGAYNEFLIRRIETLSSSEISIPDKSIVEYKEALIFGLLGVLKLRNETNCLSSVTGAKHDHSTGVIFQP
ncbi:anhydro-N-acetylmuramic acid kinase [Winogradskyella sp. 3972H.M.0a.05]|uniref:anhydro-N-acetylmuramic acid kinase n=1 Tax=Winogradskyella sp. 3972H.M.0a.05 TaxID=2950277 RepID=UPI003399B89A